MNWDILQEIRPFTRGTVDLTLVDIATGEELDMEAGLTSLVKFQISTDLITEEQERNRNILRDAMVAPWF